MLRVSLTIERFLKKVCKWSDFKIIQTTENSNVNAVQKKTDVGENMHVK